MKTLLKIFLIVSLVVLPCRGLFAQISGTLPNGTSWYLMEDLSKKGRADYALVQKDWKNIPQARLALDTLENFKDGSPYMFLVEKGVSYGENGMISYLGTSTVYEFRDVPTFDSAAADSTLLVIFDIMRECPASQAVIICGDIKAQQLADRIQTLSLTIPRKQQSKHDTAGKESPNKAAPTVFISHSGKKEACRISLEYSTPRIPNDKFNSPLPYVTARLSSELSKIMKNRLEDSFRKADIPAVGIDCPYFGSLSSPFEEKHCFSAVVSVADCSRALRLMSGELSALDKAGSDKDEFRENGGEWISDSRTPMQKCLWHYLYSIPMKTASSDKLDNKILPEETRKNLFDNYCSALLNPNTPTIRIELPRNTSVSFNPNTEFLKGWSEAPEVQFTSHLNDSVSFASPKMRLKVKFNSTDKVSGGQLWTLSNGTKVVYKKTDALNGDFLFSIILKGGYSSIQNIQAGQSAFLGDLFLLRNAGKMSSSDFNATLRSHGISMQASTDISGLCIKGEAPESKLPLVFRALLSCAKEGSPDQVALSYYKKCERLRGDLRQYSEQGLWDLLYNRMRPDYKFKETKDVDVLDESFQKAAEKYYAAQFSHFNEAVVIIEGNFDETLLQKNLCRALADFPSSNTPSVRQKTADKMKNVWYTTTCEASTAPAGDGRRALAMSIAANIPVGINSTADFYLASLFIRESLNQSLAPFGMRVELHPGFELYPKERFILNILCLPCPEEGLPAGVNTASSVKAMEVMRNTIEKLDCSSVKDAWLNGVKAELSDKMGKEFKSTDGIMYYSRMRYLFGKDLVSDYSQAVKICSRESVNTILKALSTGSRVEYTLR